MGKSANCNTILGNDHFKTEASSKFVTGECICFISDIEGRTAGVTELSEAIVKCIHKSYHGPHVFLFILTIGRLTREENSPEDRGDLW